MLHALKKLRESGFASLVEVAVTTVIFILATAGILSTISMLRPHAQESTRSLEAAYVGKGILDELRKQVGVQPGNEYFGPNLDVGIHNLGSLNGYTVSYNVTEPIPDVRKVTMTITW